MPQADAKFTDQGYKSMLALIELHHLRTGTYPATLSAMPFIGKWDQIYAQFVSYKLTDSGYELHVKNASSAASLHYPQEFWQDLGLVATNVQGFPGYDVPPKAAVP
jgi:hypothetical protein